MKRIFVEELFDYAPSVIKALHSVGIEYIDEIESKYYYILTLHNSYTNIILNRYKLYKEGQIVINHNTLPNNLKNIFIHQIPMNKSVKNQLIAKKIDTFEQLHNLIITKKLDYMISVNAYRYILSIYKQILNGEIVINKYFNNEEFMLLRTMSGESIRNLKLNESYYKKIRRYSVNSIYDLAVLLIKYNELPYIKEDIRNEILNIIKDYVYNKHYSNKKLSLTP